MLLKVGELAKHTDLTVRTLHHYDEIGLLKPSGRSDAGHRLYNKQDVSRLHAIQALQQLGLSLSQISSLLSERSTPMSLVIQQQKVMLEDQIAQAMTLHERLSLLQERLAVDNEPSMEEWLSTLASMATYGKHFSTSEIRKLLKSWDQIQDKIIPLIKAFGHARQGGAAADSLELQPLVRQFMNLTHRWTRGDFELMGRWHQMSMEKPAAHEGRGIDPALTQYIGKAVEYRLGVLLRHFTHDEMSRFDVNLDDDWQMLADEFQALLSRNASRSGKAVHNALKKWSDLIDRTVGNDPLLRDKYLKAYGTDPALSASFPLNAKLQELVGVVRLALPRRT